MDIYSIETYTGFSLKGQNIPRQWLHFKALASPQFRVNWQSGILIHDSFRGIGIHCHQYM